MGIGKLVIRLLWEQETAGSSPATRTSGRLSERFMVSALKADVGKLT